ncbi:hypothetical protein B0H16DRAFT_1563995 [Mycena metata]|uniref:Uncharacterized protein n=1 Tax=Mycena metata TaxID=1033252 RepID=A0AAD7IH25_9AGAR|nr:hypothetical protein B0H16DRAFT_1563995 [Mycena metata]
MDHAGNPLSLGPSSAASSTNFILRCTLADYPSPGVPHCKASRTLPSTSSILNSSLVQTLYCCSMYHPHVCIHILSVAGPSSSESAGTTGIDPSIPSARRSLTNSFSPPSYPFPAPMAYPPLVFHVSVGVPHLLPLSIGYTVLINKYSLA